MAEDSGNEKGSAWAMPEPEEPLPEDRELLEKIADKVVKRGLAAPAIFLLEAFKPFSFIGQQLAVFFDPLINTLIEVKDYPKIVRLLEYRENIELLREMIEEHEAIKVKEKHDDSGQGKNSKHPGD
ncbi:MAG: hypothetical protein J7M18_06010 [Candidatus Eremiobacteraeota bacterium]|nr:hypothetical protein [Candidatus Eremiobacteraeota bacterium]